MNGYLENVTKWQRYRLATLCGLRNTFLWPLGLRMLSGFAALVASSMLVSACGTGSNLPVANGHPAISSAHGPVGAVVVLKYVSFDPAFVKIKAGQAVEWKWEDAPYVDNVTFPGFASKTQLHGTYFHTFTRPGTYHYRCTLHQNMRGTVEVLPRG
ncbi:MAG: hypothetical protein M0008_05640 [Actinomycetota bacterium]|jgi:plastocyanin|nr:hypothetical protein [Actinomycetota bacterium]